MHHRPARRWAWLALVSIVSQTLFSAAIALVLHAHLICRRRGNEGRTCHVVVILYDV